MSNSSFYKVRAFGTPNAMTPNTIQNSGNKGNGYVQNFGAKITSRQGGFLVVNGTPNETWGSAIDGQFYAPKSGVVKKVVITIQTNQTVDFTVYVNNVATLPVYTPTQISSMTPSYNMYNTNIFFNTGDCITVLANDQTDKTFVSLYIE
jgi:hypothetical protein